MFKIIFKWFSFLSINHKKINSRYINLVTIILEFCPPKPKELDMAALMLAFLALVGI